VIPPFVKDPDPEVNGDFKVMEKRVIECVKNDCYIFVDLVIRENTGIYKTFLFFFELFINFCLNL
jgi:hypothetical protein